MAHNDSKDVRGSVANKYLVGTKVRIFAREATIIPAEENPPRYHSEPVTLVRYHDDGNHCWIPVSYIHEVLEEPAS